ncbi:erythromycin esterase-domain-containing protein [Echria macrotheca]|uniref:Erythromycin esterase-domain-containing protein n=1 Tax=Echria macrotheca TaxID=438768 RepID=A0AAJ0F428_9PEZI|nr:erythromycin esterase-domain-containing protein [Echria macrotheca]
MTATKLDPAISLLQANVTPFPSISEAGDALARTFDTFGSSPTKVLLIGDASHGTSEFYSFRAELTKYMITNHGFNIVALEADWPDAEAVDRYVRYRPGLGPRASLEKEREGGKDPAFMRFPTWMWRNQEVKGFVEWLREWNRGKDSKTEAVGVYGLDLYSLGTSMRAVIEYLEGVDKEMADKARKRYAGLMMWAEEPHEYGLEVIAAGSMGYEKEVVAMLRDLLRKRVEYEAVRWDGDEFHSGEQNARLVRDAENYYKCMYTGSRDESWNMRDKHMFETLVRVLNHRARYGEAKAIVWAHNSHVGDARATSMGWSRDELNIGQLCKEVFGEKALSIGCMGNTGTVAAAQRWDGDMQVMQVRPGLPGSYEELMHATGIKNFMLDLRKGRCDERLRQELIKRRMERFIGVIYAPHTERQSHYSFAVLPLQFDGLVWFNETRNVDALEAHQPQTPLEFDETWPFGL